MPNEQDPNCAFSSSVFWDKERLLESAIDIKEFTGNSHGQHRSRPYEGQKSMAFPYSCPKF